jgi:hypothetical protein
MVTDPPAGTERQTLLAYPVCELCWACAFVVAESFTAVAKVPLQDVPIFETPEQQITLLAYPEVDWLGSSACALLEPDIRTTTTLGLVHAAAVVILQESAAEI